MVRHDLFVDIIWDKIHNKDDAYWIPAERRLMTVDGNRTRITDVIVRTLDVYTYLNTNPPAEENLVLKELGISKTELYRHMFNMKQKKEIYNGGRYKLLCDGKKITGADVEAYLEGNTGSRGTVPHLERIIYLYDLLFTNTPQGGVDMEEIRERYRRLIEETGSEIPSNTALQRMIYRDLKDLELMKINLQRPSRNQPRYALGNPYLPKLGREHTMIMYLNTLLYPDSLLDEASACVRGQMEKHGFNRMQPGAGLLKERIKVIGDGLVNPSAFGGCMEDMISGLIDSKYIEFDYHKLDGTESRRKAAPLGLACKRGVWYLIGERGDKNERRTFRIDQISRIEKTEETFSYPPDFKLDAYLQSSWGIFNNDEIVKVKLKFAPGVAKRLEIMRYHPSQHVEQHLDDGSIIISYRIQGLMEMQSWIIQWGESVEVLEPESLRGSIRATAQRLLAMYGSQE